MWRVDDERSPFLPQMLPLVGARCRNTFAAPDWSLWFSEVGDHKSPGLFAVLTFGAAGLNLPYIAVARNGEFDVPLGARGQPVQLESIDFTQRFLIRADDARAAVMLVDQGMEQWLLDCDRVSFQITGPVVSGIVKIRQSQRLQAEELGLLFRFLDGFAAHVPGLVRTEFSAPLEHANAAMAAMRIVSNP